MQQIQQTLSNNNSNQWDIDKIFAYTRESYISQFNSNDSILYALGIGISQNPLNKSDLQFTYEKNQKFTIFPTFATVHSKVDILQDFLNVPGIPKINPDLILHGECSLEILKPLQTNTKYLTTGRILDFADKGKGTFFTYQYQTFEVDDQGNSTNLVYLINNNYFVRQLTGSNFKGKGFTNGIPFKTPKDEQPHRIQTIQTRQDQAILYRLSGDYNPLHIDPDVSEKVGFKKPILHGLCFYGMAAKSVNDHFCNGDSDLLQKISMRFTSSVFPGEKITFNMWKNKLNQVIVQGIVEERNAKVIIGLIQLKQQPNL